MTNDADIGFLTTLEEVIKARLSAPTADSYVATLVGRGDKRLAQKVGEEAVELALATAAGHSAEQLEEAADLVFHLLVLLQAKGLSLSDVARVLEQRHNAA